MGDTHFASKLFICVRTLSHHSAFRAHTVKTSKKINKFILYILWSRKTSL